MINLKLISKELARQVAGRKQALRRLMKDWEIYPGGTIDELAILAERLFEYLDRGASQGKIERILFNELISTYGITPLVEDCYDLSMEIKTWWEAF